MLTGEEGDGRACGYRGCFMVEKVVWGFGQCLRRGWVFTRMGDCEAGVFGNFGGLFRQRQKLACRRSMMVV